jgi:hypothetical protein
MRDVKLERATVQDALQSAQIARGVSTGLEPVTPWEIRENVVSDRHSDAGDDLQLLDHS